jgi:GTP-binding protein
LSDANFIDYVKIFCRSGKGGAGSPHFYRDKRTAKGGPDGGDGGRGGNIILIGNINKWTLLHLKYKRHIFAGDGGIGLGQMKKGADGEDIYIEVPLGTIAKNAETGEVILEITEHDQQKTLINGGRGGKGNTFFKSATNRAPQYAQPGEEGIEDWFILELKILADVGLVGFPNAGKSTLLSSISAAKPKIANYEFTTLTPNLGMVEYYNEKSFVMADIPGIIEGAAEGKGLGVRFLRHIERNSILLFMIPVDSKNIKNEYKILLNELKEYNPELLDKTRLLAISKIDMLDEEMLEQLKPEIPEVPYIFISSVAGKGLNELKDMIWNSLNETND